MQLYPQFYKRFGVRRDSGLRAVELNPLEKLELPKATIVHYLPVSSTDYGMGSDDALLKGVDRMIMVDHVTEITGDEGRPKKLAIDESSLIRKYQRQHRKMKTIRNVDQQLRDDRTVMVVNYALLPHLYRYTSSLYSAYYRRRNLHKTVLDKMQGLAKQLPDRQQYLSLTLPDNLPSVAEFMALERKVDQQSLENFNSQENIFLSDLWTWLGENREQSLLGQLGKDTLDRVNLVLQEADRWWLINLGTLDDFRSGDGEESDGVIAPRTLQRLMLKAVMSVYEAGTLMGGEDDADQSSNSTQDDPTPKGTQGQTPADDSPEALDEELNALSDLQRKRREQARQVEQGPVSVGTDELDYSASIMNDANAIAGSGLMSAAEYRRVEKLSTKYKSLPNPYTGKGTLEEAARITQDDLAMPESQPLPDSPAILDKSMLHSSVNDFTSTYINKVLPKDILNMVMGVQQAGFAIDNYEVERFSDIANDYDIHTVRVIPVNGSPSTLKFRIPRVNEDGTYMASAVRYRLRSQRGDLPIRKVKPSRVALTSYYGKIFVNRSERATEDYGRWLFKQLSTIGLDSEDDRVTDLKASTVFDQSLTVPRLYSTLAQYLMSFKSGSTLIYVDYANRYDKFGEDRVRAAETDGRVVMGQRGDQLIVVDDRDTLYLVGEGGSLDVLGRIEDIVGIDVKAAPTEVADLMVFSKHIPMGLVLSYYLGIDTVISRMKGEVRRLRSGERTTLEDNEFTVRFEDETLVVNRDDTLGALLLAGFNRYHRSIKRYPLSSFNRPEVYQSILEDQGLGVRYIREMDQLRKLFVDPITRDILVQMKEPTEWVELLYRSCELLLTDYAPAETDMTQMRIKGYERFAGTVYSEMVQSLRQFNARQGSTRNQLEMSPHAVWNAIQTDPSKSLIELSNPIQNLKEKESVTYGGTGGRSRRSMVARSRIYHRSDMGTISEANVDSGDVGINTYLTANPKFNSLRGITDRYDPETDGPSNLVSSSMLLAPAADTDDQIRSAYSVMSK